MLAKALVNALRNRGERPLAIHAWNEYLERQPKFLEDLATDCGRVGCPLAGGQLPAYYVSPTEYWDLGSAVIFGLTRIMVLPDRWSIPTVFAPSPSHVS